uniref:ribonuclease H n=1 Tax=Parascaris equorum TaxID=6256 RepID=A0A914RDV8_PAREQ
MILLSVYVARGHRPGVYKTWAECQEQTKDFKGAKFKKFTEEDEAKFFAEGNTLKQIGAQVLSSLTRPSSYPAPSVIPQKTFRQELQPYERSSCFKHIALCGRMGRC